MAATLKREHIDKLTKIIKRWNADRLDLFEISVPNEYGEFFGVMRFYFQEEGEKVATKCIRVTSTATTLHVINTLIEKFRPDMRLLSRPAYALYEVHINGDERKLDDDEKPLLVQLHWNNDDREGRFLLKSETDRHKSNNGLYYRGPDIKISTISIDPNYGNNMNYTVGGQYVGFEGNTFSRENYSTRTAYEVTNNNGPFSPKANHNNMNLNMMTNGFATIGGYHTQTQNQNQNHDSVCGSINEHEDSIYSTNSSKFGAKGNAKQTKEKKNKKKKDKSTISSSTLFRNFGTLSNYYHKGLSTTKLRKNDNNHVNLNHTLNTTKTGETSLHSTTNGHVGTTQNGDKIANEKISDKLYEAMPETSFTRSISNPEAVMRRRRAQKLEKKLRMIQANATGNDDINNNKNEMQTLSSSQKMSVPDIQTTNISYMGQGQDLNFNKIPLNKMQLEKEKASVVESDKGGMIKIYGEALKPGVPYKTLLLTNTDTAAFVIREVLDKYGMSDHDLNDFCLYKAVQVRGKGLHLNVSGEEDIYESALLNISDFEPCYFLQAHDIPLMIMRQSTHSLIKTGMNSSTGSQPKEIMCIGPKPAHYESIMRAQQNAHKEIQSTSNTTIMTANAENLAFTQKMVLPTTVYSIPHKSSNAKMESSPQKSFHSENCQTGISIYNNNVHNAAATIPLNDSISILYNRNIAINTSLSEHKISPLKNEYGVENENKYPNHVVEQYNTCPILVPSSHKDTQNCVTNDVRNSVFSLTSPVIQVGSAVVIDPNNINSSSALKITGLNIQPLHCILSATHLNDSNKKEAQYMLTPCGPHAKTFINDESVQGSQILINGSSIRFGMDKNVAIYTYYDIGKYNFNSLSNTPNNTKSQSSNQVMSPEKNTVELNMPMNELLHYIFKYDALPLNITINFKTLEILPSIFALNESQTSFISQAWVSEFKLSPAYLCYLILRYFVNKIGFLRKQNTDFSSQQTNEIQQTIGGMEYFCSNLGRTLALNIENNKTNPITLTFWLANMSEILYAMEKDVDFLEFTKNNHTIIHNAGNVNENRNCLHFLGQTLKSLIQFTYELLCKRLCYDIATLLPYLLQAPSTINPPESDIVASCTPLVKTLTSLMNMLKQHRLNGSIIIQIFTRLFKYAEAWILAAIFNQSPHIPNANHFVMAPGTAVLKHYYGQDDNSMNTTYPSSKDWTHILSVRAHSLKQWADSNGLELALEICFSRFMQVIQLLQLPKNTINDCVHISNMCPKLNSLQIYTILTQYRYAPYETTIPNDLIEKAVNIAHATTDQMIKADLLHRLKLCLENPNISPEQKQGIKHQISKVLQDFQVSLTVHDSYLEHKENYPYTQAFFIAKQDEALSIPDDGFSFDVMTGIIPEFVRQIKSCLSNYLELHENKNGQGWNVHFHSRGANMSDNKPNNSPFKPSTTHFNTKFTSPQTPQIPDNSSLKSPIQQTNDTNFSSRKNQVFDPNNSINHSRSPPNNVVISGDHTTSNLQQSCIKSVTITKTQNGLGLSILAAKVTPNSDLGIYVKAVVSGGAAQQAGAPKPGDKIVSVNGISLLGVDESIAANLMSRAGPILTLQYIACNERYARYLENGSSKSPDTLVNGGENNKQHIKSHQNNNLNSLAPTYKQEVSLTQSSFLPQLENNNFQYTYQANNMIQSSNVKLSNPFSQPFMTHSITVTNGDRNILSPHNESIIKSTTSPNIFLNSPLGTQEQSQTLNKVPYSGTDDIRRLEYSPKALHSHRPNTIDDDNKNIIISNNNPPLHTVTKSIPLQSQCLNPEQNVPQNLYNNNKTPLNIKPIESDVQQTHTQAWIQKHDFQEAINHTINPQNELTNVESLIEAPSEIANVSQPNINQQENEKGVIPDGDRYIGPKEKLTICQEMMAELQNKGDTLNAYESEKLNALIMEYEFQRRLMEEEQSDDDDNDGEGDEGRTEPQPQINMIPPSTIVSNYSTAILDQNNPHIIPSSSVIESVCSTQDQTNTNIQGENVITEKRAPEPPTRNSSSYMASSKSVNTFTSLNSKVITPIPANNIYQQLPNALNTGPNNLAMNSHNTTNNFDTNTLPETNSNQAIAYMNNMTSSNTKNCIISPPPMPSNTHINVNTLSRNDPTTTTNLHSDFKPLCINHNNNESPSPLLSSYGGTTNNHPSNYNNANSINGRISTNSNGNSYARIREFGDKTLQDISDIYAAATQNFDEDYASPNITSNIHDNNVNIKQRISPSNNSQNGSITAAIKHVNPTPGVIGAQEVYLDPRIKSQMRKQMEQLQGQKHESPIPFPCTNQGPPLSSNRSSLISSNNSNSQQTLSSTHNSINVNNTIFNGVKLEHPMLHVLDNTDINNSPERMSFREKMKKFAQVSTLNACTVNNVTSINNSNGYVNGFTTNFSTTTSTTGAGNVTLEHNGNNRTSFNDSPIMGIEKLRISRTQKRIEDSLFHGDTTNNGFRNGF